MLNIVEDDVEIEPTQIVSAAPKLEFIPIEDEYEEPFIVPTVTSISDHVRNELGGNPARGSLWDLTRFMNYRSKLALNNYKMWDPSLTENEVNKKVADGIVRAARTPETYVDVRPEVYTNYDDDKLKEVARYFNTTRYLGDKEGEVKGLFTINKGK
jgi:hypothetical protein